MLTYKKAGVDVTKSENLIEGLKEKIHSTFNPFVLNSIGGFASLTEIPRGYQNPVLATSTDGVGTKLKIAFQSGKHDTVGIDLVAMCANDILTVGAQPFFFLDYYACGIVQEAVYKNVLSGICEGCVQAGCALIGGETAEMPSFYSDNEYDLAGFVVGFVEKEKIIDGSKIIDGNVVIALPSSGLHSNGFSLVRKVFFDVHNFLVTDYIKGINSMLYEELLKPTKIYVKAVQNILESFNINGMAHITGGGLPGNIKRIVPDGLTARIKLSNAEIPHIFKLLMELGDVSFEEMCSTFNMGIGYIIIADKNDEQGIINKLMDSGEKAFKIGYINKASDNEKVYVSLTDR
ncbi:MAG: phosphoribosylformylglycinamidine cyclo-ligase [Proteobacteria bacterium]|nr:phosphoribosylformylglycinamidine cyclo-ligase [Pseudomonadota bacterium]